ncbi:hypothetical protein [uncultured Muribaculum sp.]|nr:hypothetical protein [uncultured Muribaculum sp.]
MTLEIFQNRAYGLSVPDFSFFLKPENGCLDCHLPCAYAENGGYTGV